MARSPRTSASRVSTLAITALMVVPALFAAFGTATAANGHIPAAPQDASCHFGSGDVCIATYNGPDALMMGTGETTLGVNPHTGKIMMSAQSIPLLVSVNPPGGLQKTARISFDDSTLPPTPTWEDATNTVAGQPGTNAHGNLDPMLWVDTLTGRTIAGGDSGSCTAYYAMTDDDGHTWNPLPPLGCAGAEDHPTIGSGPFHGGPPTGPSPTGSYPHVFYFCQQENVGICVTSTDGGITFGAPVTFSGAPCTSTPGTFGHIRVGPDGTAYVPFQRCDSNSGGTRTQDNGKTWTGFHVPGMAQGNFDPSIAAGRADKFAGGRLYYMNVNPAGHPAVAMSTDEASTWTAPVDLAVASQFVSGDAIGVHHATFTLAIAGDDDRGAVAFMGTKDTGTTNDPFNSGFTGMWHQYIAFTYDGGIHWRSYDVSPNDPVQSGQMCSAGISCTSGRNLFDFADITMDNDGRVIVGYPDGCLPEDGCTNTYSKDSDGYVHNAQGSIARQYGGKGLLASKDSAAGHPIASITNPTSGATLSSGIIPVTGTVSRTGGTVNAAPTATLVADHTTGAPPLAVSFTASGSDTDGTITAWSLAFGDGSPNATGTGALVNHVVPHTYAAAGTFKAKLTVNDNAGGVGSTTVTIIVSALPIPDGTLAGAVTVYDVDVDVNEVIAQDTGSTTGQNIPTYVPGEEVGIEARSTTNASSVPLAGGTPCDYVFYDAAGHVVRTDPCRVGNEATAGQHYVADNSNETPVTLPTCTPSTPVQGPVCGVRENFMTIPLDWDGIYYIAPVVHSNGDHIVKDTVQNGLKAIHVIGPASPTASLAKGHLANDKIGDTLTGRFDLAWADASVVGDQVVMTTFPRALPTLAAAGGTGYVFNLNGERFLVTSTGTQPSIVDLTNGKLPHATVAWAPSGMLTVKIDRSYLRALAQDCPCRFSVESVNGVVTADRLPDAGTVAVPMGSAQNPDATDPSGDVDPVCLTVFGAPCPVPTPQPVTDAISQGAPWADITALWIDQETATSFNVTLKVKDMSQLPPSAPIADPTGVFGANLGGVSFTYTVDFCTDNNVITTTADHTVCYLVDATNGVQGATGDSGSVASDGTGCTGVSGMLDSVKFDTAASTVTWKLEKAGFDIKAQYGQACTSGGTRGGSPITNGNHLTKLQGRSGASVGAVFTFTPTFDSSDPATARTYTFGQYVTPLVVSAGGSYSGAVGGTIPIAATISGGKAPYSCAWTGVGASFASASSCATTVSYSSGGSKTIMLTVTDAQTPQAQVRYDNATVTVASVAGERVEVYANSEASPRSATSVSTGASSPAASWFTDADLSDLSGPTTLTAKWFDADNSVLATSTVSITLTPQTAKAFVTITNPADDPTGAHPVSGTIDVSGTAGHSTGAGMGKQFPTGPFYHASASVTETGTIMVPCPQCPTALAASPEFELGSPGSDTLFLAGAGIDGYWFDVSAFKGAKYKLSEEFGATPDIVFTDNSFTKGDSNQGTDLNKTGTIPTAADYAFVYVRTPSPAQVQQRAGVINTVDLVLTPQPHVPSAPTALAATGGQAKITLAWTASDDDGNAAPLTYLVFRGSTQIANVTATNYVDSQLADTTTFTYTVKAQNSAWLTSNASASATATTNGAIDTTPPSAVSNLAANAISATQIKVTWNAATDNPGGSGVNHYDVYRSANALFTPAPSNHAGSTSALSFTDNGLTGSTTYYYEVLASDAANNVGPATAPASATTPVGTVPIGKVSLTLDGAASPFATVNVNNGAWSTTLDTTKLTDTKHTILAAYDDGAGGSTSVSTRFTVANTQTIAITSPTSGSTVDRPFTVTGTTTGTGGASAPMANSMLLPNGNLATDSFAVLAAKSSQMAKLVNDLKGSAGFLGAAPSVDGTSTILAYFSGAVPSDLHASDVPPTWVVRGVGDLQMKPAIEVVKGFLELPLSATDAPPQAGSQATGIGPGSHILIDISVNGAAYGTFGCTANFVWKDSAGNLYLGAAGHCFLPTAYTNCNPCYDYFDSTGHGANGQPTTDPLWNFDVSQTQARVCISNCLFGGQLGFIDEGTTTPLGHVIFARQNGVGDDFGIVAIPVSDRSLIREDMPVWHGPHSVGQMQAEDIVGFYGNAAGLGETFPTMARGGIGTGNNGNAWYGDIASFEGDSGSAVVSLAPDTSAVLHGDRALGILTHLSCCTIGVPPHNEVDSFVAGTTMERAVALASNERGISLTPLMSGDPLPTAASVPSAPTGLTPTPGSGQVALSWTAPVGDGGSAITSYTVRYGTGTGGPYPSTQTVTGTSTTVTGLTNGITYYFVVAATNGAGTGSDSAQAAATPTAVATRPGAPTNVQALAGDGQVTLSWTAPPNGGSAITQYTVSYGTSSGSYTSSVQTANTATNVAGLTNNVAYYFVVSATNSVGTGAASSEASAKPTASTGTSSYHVDVRLIQSGTPVADWTSASYDGSTFSHTFAGFAPGAYSIEARLSNATNVRDTKSVSFTAGNRAPIVSAGPGQKVNERAPVQLAGSASDPDGDSMTYAWARVSGPSMTFSDPTVLNPTFTAPHVTSDQALVLSLTATDAYGSTAQSSVTITIIAADSFSIDTVNGAPIDRANPPSVTNTSTIGGTAHASTSPPQSAASLPSIVNLHLAGRSVSADAGVSSPSGARVLSYVWSYGDGAVSLGAHAQHTYLVPGSYPLTLTIRDGQGIVSQARVSVLALSGSGSGTETYYLHKISCQTGQTNNPQFMDRTPASGSEAGNGCGSFGTGMLATDQKWDSHDATAISYPSGSTVVAHVFGYTLTPSPSTSLSGVLRADGNVVGTASATMQSLTGPVSFVGGPAGCAEWAISMTTTAAIPSNAILSLEVTAATGQGEVVVCYAGGTAASRVDLLAGSTGGGSSSATATIVQPADGANVPQSTSTSVTGTATFPTVETAKPMFLRQDDCPTGANAVAKTYLSLTDAKDAGDACQPTGNGFTVKYPLEASSLPITLSPTGHVTGKLYVTCDGANPAIFDATILVDGASVGTQSQQGVCVNAAKALPESEVDIDMALPSSATGHPVSSFELDIKWTASSGLQWISLDSPASYIVAPVAAPPTGSIVQVAVDDPTFTNLLGVTGTDTWSASWDTSALVPGSTHTIYARAGTASGFGTTTTHTVTVGQAQQTRTAGAQVQIVPTGGSVMPNDWADASMTGDQWTYSWSTMTLQNGLYDVHARETINGAAGTKEDLVTLQVANRGRAPTVDLVADQSGAENATLSVNVSAHDLDGNPLVLSLAGLPGAFLTDNHNGTGTIWWTPTYGQAGAYDATLTAKDAKENLQASRTFKVTISHVDRPQYPPVLRPIDNKAGFEGAPLTINVSATDADGDAIALLTSTLPPGASFVDHGDGTGVFSWTPGPHARGDYSVTFRATDGVSEASQAITIRVAPTNGVPAFQPIGDKSVRENDSLDFVVSAVDSDGDPLTYSASGVLRGASFDADRRVFSWVPDFAQAGSYVVSFHVTDGANETTENASITVVNVNRAPVVSGATNAVIKANRTLHMSVPIVDPDQDPLTYNVTGLPDGAVLNASSGMIVWRPVPVQVGNYSVAVAASDGEFTTYVNLTISVAENLAPIISVDVPATAEVLRPSVFVANASDPDGTTPPTLAWDFDASDGFQAQRTGANVSWAFQGIGNFTVTVRATDADGMQSFRSFNVSVDDNVALHIEALTGQSDGSGSIPARATVTNWNGTHIANATVTVNVYYEPFVGAGKFFSRTLTATTGEDGSVVFMIPSDTPFANARGRHVIEASAITLTSFGGDQETAQDATTYTV